MLRELRYLFAYSLPLSAVLALQGEGLWTYATVIYAFGILPFFDQWAPQERSNDRVVEEDAAGLSRFFDVLLYLNVPIFYGLLYLLFERFEGDVLSLSERIGLILSLGIVAGTLGINVAHELGHRNNPWEQFLAKALLLPCLYMHFYIEHNRGHHKHVGTPADPATARYNEWIYSFWLRSVLGSWINAWKLASQPPQGKTQISVLSLRNEMLQFTVLQSLYLLLVGLAFGWSMLAVAVGVAVVGFLLLESVNYIEHYGLMRQRLESGRFEAVTPKHSWNSEHELGRIILYELTRHADHHYKSTRPYQSLRYLEESPQLPLGYPGSILLALVPPLWFAVMNPRIPEWSLEAPRI